jgi:hypothetical protein
MLRDPGEAWNLHNRDAIIEEHERTRLRGL